MREKCIEIEIKEFDKLTKTLNDLFDYNTIQREKGRITITDSGAFDNSIITEIQYRFIDKKIRRINVAALLIDFADQHGFEPDPKILDKTLSQMPI